MTEPALSVIVAAVNSRRTAEPFFAALGSQIGNRPIEVIYVSNTVEPAASPALAACPNVTRVESSDGRRLVPELWSAGLKVARGNILVLTITACTPAEGWIDAWLDAHRGARAGIGGPIACGRGATLVDRAVYLTRYSAYAPPVAAGPVADIPGDNGSYKRTAIARYLDGVAREGFWEATINRDVVARGGSLAMEQRASVTHTSSYGLIAFSRLRYVHGRHFGRERAANMSRGQRAVRVIAAPTVPLVMSARIARRVPRHQERRLAFAAAMPIVVWFTACWATGELVGLIRG